RPSALTRERRSRGGRGRSSLPLITSEQTLGKGKREKAKRSALDPVQTSLLKDVKRWTLLCGTK
ncbi:Uncharacterized protein DAT39_006182, partial [Clarias magur]